MKTLFTTILLIGLLTIPHNLLAWTDSPIGSANITKNANLAKGQGGSPVGSIMAWNSYTMPDNDWLECNGQAVPADATEYITKFGWYTPNYQGMFLRGYGEQGHWQNNGSNAGVTETWHMSGDLNEVQGDAIRNITGFAHDFTFGPEAANLWDGGAMKRSFSQYRSWVNIAPEGYYRYPEAYIQAGFDFDASRTVPTATEIRPVNKAVKYIIKVR